MFRLFCFLCCCYAFPLTAQDMNNARLDSLLHLVVDTIVGGEGRWELKLPQINMLVITDEAHDRMRIISPVRNIEDASPEEIFACMEANFHSALDVKYALSDQVIWVAFIHPLSPLSDGQLLDALRQVRAATLTYGTLYSSTDMVFPGSQAEKKRAQEGAERKRGKRL